MARKEFNNGMEAGARPFEEKFQRQSAAFEKVAKTINEKIDDIDFITDNIINDLNSIEKKRLYDLNTIIDIGELGEDEKELLLALLYTLANMTNNVTEYQQTFFRSIKNYLNVKNIQTFVDLSAIENIENINDQKAILQTIMEFLFLENANHGYMDEYEDVIEYFSVNKKGIREIQECIDRIYKATGLQGIAENYGYVVIEETEGDDKNDATFNETYDGSDICEACADIVSKNKYVVLKDYIAIKDNSYNVILISKIDGSKKSLNIKLIGMDKLHGSCNHLCIEKVEDKELVIINVESFEVTNVYLGDRIQQCVCTEDNFFFTKSEEFQSSPFRCNYELFQYNFIKKTTKHLKYIEDGNNILTPDSFLVIQDNIYFHSSDYSYRSSLLKFNYKTNELEDLCSNEQLAETDRFSLDIYNNYIYAITKDNMGYVYADLEKPNIMKSVKFPVDSYTNIEILKAYGTLYYFKLNSSFPLYKYDMSTGESILIKEQTDCGMSGDVKTGLFSKSTMYFLPTPNPQVVGKWLYYLDGKKLELSKLSLA